jgi:hypothetical protein
LPLHQRPALELFRYLGRVPRLQLTRQPPSSRVVARRTSSLEGLTEPGDVPHTLAGAVARIPLHLASGPGHAPDESASDCLRPAHSPGVFRAEVSDRPNLLHVTDCNSRAATTSPNALPVGRSDGHNIADRCPDHEDADQGQPA